MYLVKSYTNSDHTKDIKYYIFKFVKGKKKQQLEFVERSLKTMVAANNFSFPQNIVFTNKSELHRRDIWAICLNKQVLSFINDNTDQVLFCFLLFRKAWNDLLSLK